LQMLRRVLDSRIRVTCDFENGLPSVYGDQGMLEQVLMNLVLNARDAMPGGGELAITTSAECVQKEELKHPDARVGQFVCLAVRDTGSGIAPENLVRIFEPFFTTKQLGSGTGLGLATVYGIVKQHDGWVAVESKPGKGSAFRVYLPVRGSAVPVTGPAAQRSHSVPMGTEKILVAEDDDAVRQITARILVGLGYTVLEAASGKAAMEIWRTSKGDFDLLLSDVLMTDGLTGDALAVSLRGAKPQLKVLLT